MFTKTTLLLLASLASHALAECPMPAGQGKLEFGMSADGKTASDPNVCAPQGEGQWTFVMQLSAVDVPTGGEGGIEGGYSDGVAFAIFDNACTVRATYGKPDCEIPYIIEENFLTQVLTIKNIDTSVGGGYFKFDYGNGEYVINNNHCKCYDMSSGLQGAESCKCAFPVDGVFVGKMKRDTEDAYVSIPFKA